MPFFITTKAAELAGLQRTFQKQGNYRTFAPHHEPKEEGLCPQEVAKKRRQKNLWLSPICFLQRFGIIVIISSILDRGCTCMHPFMEMAKLINMRSSWTCLEYGSSKGVEASVTANLPICAQVHGHKNESLLGMEGVISLFPLMAESTVNHTINLMGRCD